MTHQQTLLPRPTLINVALYALSALIYSVTLFTIELARPGNHIFEAHSNYADYFNYIAICSWPVLLFGALLLIAVRIGAKVRRRRKKRSARKKRAQDKAAQLARLQLSTGQTVALNPPPSTRREKQKKRMPRNRSKSSSASGVPRVPRGYVAVTRFQRLFAAVGFLWVAVALALTTTAAVFVFLGQRERFRVVDTVLGVNEPSWRTWAIPAVTGLIPAVIYAFMALSAFFKFIGTVTARGRDAEKARSAAEAISAERRAEQDVLGLMQEVRAPPRVPPLLPLQEDGLHNASARSIEMMNLPVQPDDETVAHLMQRLEEMGFVNRHQNIAALQASSFDLRMASQKLTNAAQV